MNNALMTIIIMIGSASLVCVVVSQMQGRRRHLRRSHDGAGSDGGYYAGDDIGSLFGLSDTRHSPSDGAESGHDAGSSGDSDAGDSGGGGGDGGGDGGGGGSD